MHERDVQRDGQLRVLRPIAGDILLDDLDVGALGDDRVAEGDGGCGFLEVASEQRDFDDVVLTLDADDRFGHADFGELGGLAVGELAGDEGVLPADFDGEPVGRGHRFFRGEDEIAAAVEGGRVLGDERLAVFAVDGVGDLGVVVRAGGGCLENPCESAVGREFHPLGGCLAAAVDGGGGIARERERHAVVFDVFKRVRVTGPPHRGPFGKRRGDRRGVAQRAAAAFDRLQTVGCGARAVLDDAAQHQRGVADGAVVPSGLDEARRGERLLDGAVRGQFRQTLRGGGADAIEVFVFVDEQRRSAVVAAAEVKQDVVVVLDGVGEGGLGEDVQFHARAVGAPAESAEIEEDWLVVGVGVGHGLVDVHGPFAQRRAGPVGACHAAGRGGGGGLVHDELEGVLLGGCPAGGDLDVVFQAGGASRGRVEPESVVEFRHGREGERREGGGGEGAAGDGVDIDCVGEIGLDGVLLAVGVAPVALAQVAGELEPFRSAFRHRDVRRLREA